MLRGVPVVRVNQVWRTVITYIRSASGFAYLVAIMDWDARRVLSWRISNTLEVVFWVDCLEDGLREHGNPEMFNSDQGTQFKSGAFTGVRKRERPHQALENQTPYSVRTSSTGGEAMIVDKNGVKPEPAGFPIALRSTATAHGEVRRDNGSAMQNAKKGAAPSSCVKSGAT